MASFFQTQWATPAKPTFRFGNPTGEDEKWLKEKENAFPCFGRDLSTPFVSWYEQWKCHVLVRGLDNAKQKAHLLSHLRDYALREVVRNFGDKLKTASIDEIYSCIRQFWHGQENRQEEYELMTSVKQDINAPYVKYVDEKIRSMDYFDPKMSDADKVMYFLEGLHPKLQVLVKRRKNEFRYKDGENDVHDFHALRRLAGEEVLMMATEMTITPRAASLVGNASLSFDEQNGIGAQKAKTVSKPKEEEVMVTFENIDAPTQCFSCQGYGHKSFQCPSKRLDGSGGSASGFTTKRKVLGHAYTKINAPVPTTPLNKITCFICQKTGHKSYQCPDAKNRPNEQGLKRSGAPRNRDLMPQKRFKVDSRNPSVNVGNAVHAVNAVTDVDSEQSITFDIRQIKGESS